MAGITDKQVKKAIFLLRQKYGYEFLHWAQDGTWKRDVEELLSSIGELPSDGRSDR